MKINKYILLFAVVLVGSSLQAQQDAMYSQYMFNPFAVNPAYAGSRESFSGVALMRSQWVNMPGAPVTSSLAFHGPIANKKMALGLNMYTDRIGPTTNSAAFGTYAYHLQMKTGKLSFGLRAGMYSASLDRDAFSFEDETDQNNVGGVVRSTKPSFDFGMYYYTNHFYAGLAATHLTEPSFKFDGYDEAQIDLSRHYMFATGAAIELSRNTVFKPSVLVKYVPFAPVNVDINTSFLFHKSLWIGATLRVGNSFVLMTEYNISDKFRIGYAYDIVLNKLKRYNTGSHEIFMGFDFNIKKSNTVSPRYL